MSQAGYLISGTPLSTLKPVRLYHGLAGVEAIVYTVPNDGTVGFVMVKGLRFTNNSASATTIYWSIIPVGGSTGLPTDRMLLNTLASGDVLDDHPEQPIFPGEAISISGSPVNGVTVTVWGLVAA